MIKFNEHYKKQDDDSFKYEYSIERDNKETEVFKDHERDYALCRYRELLTYEVNKRVSEVAKEIYSH